MCIYPSLLYMLHLYSARIIWVDVLHLKVIKIVVKIISNVLETDYVSFTWKSRLRCVKGRNRLFSWNTCEKTHLACGRNVQTSEVETGDKYILTSLMLNSAFFIILRSKILEVWSLCNLYKPFVISANLRHATPRSAKHRRPVSRLAKHYVTYLS